LEREKAEKMSQDYLSRKQVKAILRNLEKKIKQRKEKITEKETVDVSEIKYAVNHGLELAMYCVSEKRKVI
jgi:hypothetical protein